MANFFLKKGDLFMLPWFVFEEVFNTIWENITEAIKVINDSIVLSFAVGLIFVGGIISLARSVISFDDYEE